MRHGRRITAMAMLAALAWPATAMAEDAFIRIAAKRGAAADAAVAEWRGRFPDVVTVPLANGMTGIVLGPQTPAEAAARMARLKAEGAIPADSYLTGPGGEAPLSGVAAALGADLPGAADGAAAPADDAATGAAENETVAEPADGPAAAAGAGEGAAAPSTATPGAAAGLTGGLTAGLTGSAPDASPATPQAAGDDAGAAPATATATAAPDASPRHIQLQATPGRVSAAEALATWRRTFPEAQLWRIPGGWYAVALPALPASEAEARIAALKDDRRIPRDAFLATPEELGRPVEAEPSADAAAPAPPDAPPAGMAQPAPDATTVPGEAPRAAASAPAAPAVMPPIAEVQRALRWAGLYDGALDGQSGPGTRAAIEARIEATGGTATPAEAMAALIAEREAWRREIGLEPLADPATGLTLLAPTGKLAFDRTERALSIYGPKDGSGAALILFAQPGGQQELEDMAGLVTALGWVPQPRREVSRGRFTLTGASDQHIGHAEGRVQDGIAEGWVLIWPAADAETARRLAIEAGESFARTGPAKGGAAVAPPE